MVEDGKAGNDMWRRSFDYIIQFILFSLEASLRAFLRDRFLLDFEDAKRFFEI